MTDSTEKKGQVETTGHVWDGDLREYNNPLPRWWLWAFYGTVVFAVVYWFLYPAWPVGNDYTKGVNTITYSVENEDGEMVEHTTHWNSRALLERDMRESPAAVRQADWVQRVEDMSFEEIVEDPNTLNFARSMGRGLFGDYCAACHGMGGEGQLPYFPSLVNGNWIWGSSYEQIEQTLINGRKGNMPGFANIQGEARDDLVQYVLSLSGTEGLDDDAVQRGKAGYAVCAGCHGMDGSGNPMLGAPNLTNQAWSYIDIPGAETLEEKEALVAGVITNGIEREMPGFGERLDPVSLKMLSIYVREMSGQ
ncbi:MAG: cbb3-type cytochrome c oxidase N-terminal domain-containing protein [Halothiobacillaceae bacterium]